MSSIPEGDGEAGVSREAAGKEIARPERARRFYSDVAVEAREGAFVPLLDGRPIRTPARAPLALPRPDMAEAIAEEWRRQGAEIDPATLTATRLANSAIDGVATRRDEVIADIVRFAGSDLLYYRAQGPGALVRRQAAQWDPVLAEAERAFEVRFVLAEGLMPVDQPPEGLERIGAALLPLDPFALAGLHQLTTLTGSAHLGLAFHRGSRSLEEIWRAAHVDEDWNIELWGEDAEARARRDRQFEEATAAALFVRPEPSARTG